jgi:hypothetical protein
MERQSQSLFVARGLMIGKPNGPLPIEQSLPDEKFVVERLQRHQTSQNARIAVATPAAAEKLRSDAGIAMPSVNLCKRIYFGGHAPAGWRTNDREQRIKDKAANPTRSSRPSCAFSV